MQSSDGALRDGSAMHEALAASEARFHNIIARNADGILVVGPDGVIRYANPAATRLLGRTYEQLVGEEFGIPIVPGETTEIDLWIAPEEVRIAELRTVPTEWEETPALLATLRDVSERKRLEEQLRQKVNELAEADNRKDEFLAMLAHELRNPLAPLRNAAQILKLRADEPSLVSRMSHLITAQVRNLERLVDDLLDVSRITRGKIRLRKESISLDRIVLAAVETSRQQLEAKGHRFELVLPREPVHLFADPVRIEQVLVNLVSNAVKYTDPGGQIRLECRIEGDELITSVRDNGIGLSPEMIDRVFELFAQVDQSLDRAHGGLGIGLTLARRLTELHGGSLTAHSDGPGQGSEFRLRLKIEHPQEPSDRDHAALAGLERSASRRVLVVDDHRSNAESLCTILEIWGHQSRMALDGMDAIREAQRFQPEFILLDIGLPGLDGYSVARFLSETPHPSRPVLIAMTGYGRDEDRKLAFESGFTHFLVKPIDLELLERLLVPS